MEKFGKISTRYLPASYNNNSLIRYSRKIEILFHLLPNHSSFSIFLCPSFVFVSFSFFSSLYFRNQNRENIKPVENRFPSLFSNASGKFVYPANGSSPPFTPKALSFYKWFNKSTGDKRFFPSPPPWNLPISRRWPASACIYPRVQTSRQKEPGANRIWNDV